MNTSPRHIGQYELQEHLRRDGLAEIWKALDTQSQRFVAIKLFHFDQQTDPNFITRFEREARISAALHHPNIVQIRDFQISHSSEANNSFAYIVMDYVHGQTLADYIHSTSHIKRFPSAVDIVQLFTAISLAIDYAHQQGVVHRHIKPSNILLDKGSSEPSLSGASILVDFATDNVFGSADGLSNEASLYLAPEQAHGYSGNELSDIYSLGVMLYEICTGTPPFHGDTPAAIGMQHINAMPQAPALLNPNIPPTLTSVILRSLTKDPALRFSSAASMTSTLAAAFNLPVPEGLLLSARLAADMSEPTYYRPLRTDLLSSSPSIQVVRASSPPPATFTGDIPVVARAKSQPDPSMMASSPPVAASALSLPITPIPASAPPPAAKRRRKGFIIALLVLLLLVLVGSGLGAFFLLPHKSPVTIPTSSVLGQAFFISSGKLKQDNIPAINDELLIKLHNMPNPNRGKSYYAWLLTDIDQLPARTILLGMVPVNHGEVNRIYHSQGNINLLALTSRLLITEENAQVIPTHPSSDLSTWYYYAELLQKPNRADTTNHASMLTHLRYLLSEEPTLKQAGLSGGLADWFAKNTGKVLEGVGSARDDWTTKSSTLLRIQLISVLEYLDGSSFVQMDLPSGTNLPIDSRFASVALLQANTQNQTALSYPGEMIGHLNAIAQSPGTTSDKRQLIGEINTALNHVTNWLQKVHDDAEQLIKLSDAQLLLPSSQVTLDEMQTLAFYAYVGQFDSSTSKLEAGAIQIQYDIEHLAAFDVAPYTRK